MERKLNTASIALVYPASKGWQVLLSGSAGTGTHYDSIAEAAASLPAESVVEIALPVSRVVVERMTLPALDRAELAGMVHLQLEKSLPFPVEDVTSNFQVIGRTESESTLLAVAINNAHFIAFCQPFRARSISPQRASFFATHLGHLCPPDLSGLLIYQEEEKQILAIYSKGKLAFVQILPGLPVGELMSEIPAILFGAELDGVSTDFSTVCLDRGLAEMEAPLKELLSLPVKLVSTILDAESFKFAGDQEGDLLPESFLRERQQQNQTARIKSNLATAAIVYLLLLAMGFGYLIFLQHRVNKIDAQIAALQPDLAFVQSRMARWNQLAPAIDRNRFAVELLSQACASLPSDAIRIQTFEAGKDHFFVEGEAPTAALAVEYGQQMEKNAAFQDYKFEIKPPTILANEHAQLRISANL